MTRPPIRREFVLGLLLGLLAILGLLLAGHAVLGQVPPPLAPATPSSWQVVPPNGVAVVRDRPAWINWLDRQLVPAVRFAGENPVILAMAIVLLTYLVAYIPIAVCLVWTLKARYGNDRKACSFRVLFIWNLLEFTALSPWVMIGRTAKHYWPGQFKPWEDTGAGKGGHDRSSQRTTP